MDPRAASSGDGPPQPPAARNELRGPRPAPLSVSKESHKIRKRPPLAPNLQLAHAPPPPPPPPPSLLQPMIIYTLSPKVIHTTTDDFMVVVQRLTGWSSSDAASGGAVSPAARLAAIERTSPSERERDRERAGDLVGLAGEAGVEVGRNPGILSPSPAILPAISPSIFSPVTDPNNFSLLNDLSPFLSWNNSFLAHPSPSSLFSNPLVSPAASPDLFFNQFLDL